MIIKRKSHYFLFLLVYMIPCMAQNATVGTTEYSIETSGSASKGKYTPFWIVSNRYGVVPLDVNNAFLRTGVFHAQSLGNRLHWSAGIDMLAATPRYRTVYLQQLFAAIQYKNLNLTVGSHENYMSLWDRELSSGDLVLSPNARPVPEINLSVPKFTPVPFTKRYLQFRGHIALGKSFDSRYLQSFVNENTTYVENVRWHHKSLQLRFIDPDNHFPLTAVAGMHHSAQWGGTSTNPKLGKQPQSFKDLIRVILGKSGGDDASLSDRINVLGNHYGSYEVQFGYLHTDFNIHIYKQHFFDDVSGMELYNIQDGLYGLQIDIQSFSPINKIVVEYLDTRYQSGPLHWLWFDRDKYPGYGGGMDNYYNNGEYTTGISYFNRSLGSPLLTSPEYNENNALGFHDNRIRAFHLGFQGYLSQQFSYRLLSTSSESWGTMARPLLKKKNNFSLAAKISYRHPRLEDWLFTAEVAADTGSQYGDNTGISISIKKTGILKRWN